MNLKQVGTLLFFASVPFIANAFFRELIVGFDSYYFITSICSGKMIELHYGLMPELLKVLPCNFLALKFLLFTILLFCVFALAKTGELFFPRHGWLAGVFCFLSPVMVSEFAKFENDQFAFPFLFAGLYFFAKGLLLFRRNERHWLEFQLLGLLLPLLGFFLFWEGAGFFVVGLSLSSVFFVLPVVFPSMFFGKIWKTGFEWSARVWENLALNGWAILFLSWIGVLGIPLELMASTVFFLLLAGFNFKFLLFALPFLSIGCVGVYRKWKNSEKTWAKELSKSFKRIPIWLVIIFSFSHLLFQPPHQNQVQAINYAIQQANNNKVSNDWDLGWIVKWKNGKTKNKAWPGYDWNRQTVSGILITREDANCLLQKRFETTKVFNCERS